MPSKIGRWLVGAGDGKIGEVKVKSGIENNCCMNLVSPVYIFSRLFQEFPVFLKIPERVLK